MNCWRFAPNCHLLLTRKHLRSFVSHRYAFRSISPLQFVHFLTKFTLPMKSFQLVGSTLRAFSLSSRMKEQTRTILLIDENGQNLGEKTLTEALLIAKERSQNIASVNKEERTASIPVYKLVQKGDRKQADNRRGLKRKEISVGDRIAAYDLNFRIKRCKALLEKGYSVKFSVTGSRKQGTSSKDKLNIIKKVEQEVMEAGIIYGKPSSANSHSVSCLFRPHDGRDIDATEKVDQSL